MSAEDISQFIPYYPSRENPDLGFELFRKKELYDLKLEYSENIPSEPGIFLQSQEIAARILSPYTDITEQLINHGVGTGKSCLASLVIENFKKHLVDDGPRRPALVFVNSEDLKRNLENEISQRCTKDKYIEKYTDAELRRIEKGGSIKHGPQVKAARIRKMISKTYNIVTTSTFLRHLPTKDVIKKRFSNICVFVDEVHNLRIQPGKKKGDLKMRYNRMWEFLHTIENCRIALLTGTPMWDQANEISSIMNLILPEDTQLPTGNNFDKEFFDKDENLYPKKAEELKELFRGRISVLRPLMTTAVRREIGVTKPWLRDIIVYPDAMSQLQHQIVEEAKTSAEKKTIFKKQGDKVIKIEKQIVSGGFWRFAMQAAVIIFPVFDKDGNVVGGEYGPSAFEKNIVNKIKHKKFVKGKKGEQGREEHITKIKYEIKDPRVRKEFRDNLSRYSSKFASIIKKIKDHPNEIVFIYNPSIAESGGAILLGLLLELHGFVWAKSSSQISKVDSKNRKRFIVISSKEETIHNPKEIEKVLASVSSPDNKYAERCQIIIGGKKIREGFTIKNARQGHSIFPSWNESELDQAFGRIFRTGSHDELPEDERYVNIYRHVAVQEADYDEESYNLGKGFPSDVSFTDEETIDLFIYRKMAETKEHKKSQINRVIKIISADCALLYKRNVLTSDQKKTRACDYGDCNYVCDNFPEKHIDKSGKVWNYHLDEDDIIKDTYYLYYAQPKVQELVNGIIELYRSYFALDFYMILKLIDINEDTGDRILLLHALNFIINQRILLRNRYGFSCYLKEKGDIYFLSDNISAYSDYTDNIYISEPLVTEKTSLEDISEILQIKKDIPLIQKFAKNPVKYSEILNEISYRSLIILIEEIYKLSKMKRKKTAKENDAIRIILERFKDDIKKVGFDKVVHIMYTNEYTGVGYNVAGKKLEVSGQMRIYDNETNEWKLVVDPSEEESYIEYLSKVKKAKKKITFEGNPYDMYAFIDKSGNLKIKIKAEPGKRQGMGKVYTSYKKEGLIDIFNRLNHLPPALKSHKRRSHDELMMYLKGNPEFSEYKQDLKNKSQEELAQLATLFGMNITDLGAELRKWFEAHDLFYRI